MMEANFEAPRNNISNDDPVSRIINAVNFAAIKHKTQKRKDVDRTPYINHPIGVACILTSEARLTDVSVIEAAILHDTVEDTDTSFEELEECFGKQVASIVKELTDDKSKEKSLRKQDQIDTAHKKSINAKIVGMADKIYNLRDLIKSLPVGWSEARRREYYEWAEKVCQQYYDANSTLANILKDLFRNIKS